MKLSIVIPVYNSEQTIGPLCEALIEELGGSYDLEIVTVNDGSGDGSSSVCRALYSRHPSIIRHLDLSRNFGEHNALMAGLHASTGQYIVTMDDDMQNPPGEVNKLISAILRSGLDVVYGRFIKKEHNVIRNLGSWLNGIFASMVLRKPHHLYMSSFKIMNRFVVDEIVKYPGPFPYIDGIILRTTGRIGSATVEHRQRTVKRSTYSVGKLFAVWGNMVMNFSLVPIRLIGILGVALILLGLFSKTLNLGIFLYDPPPASISNDGLLSAMLVLRGILLVALSIVGEYVGRIYLCINKEPQFIIRESLAADEGRKPRE